MKKIIVLMTGVGMSLALTGATTAATFQESMSKCLVKNANVKDAAVVMLSCTAADGKLSACKVVSDSMPGKGFDKAALCVADAMPMGSKTGEVNVPMRFPGGG